MKLQVQYEVSDKHDDELLQLLDEGDWSEVENVLANFGQMYGPVHIQTDTRIDSFG